MSRVIAFVKAYYPAFATIAAIIGFFPFLGLLMSIAKALGAR